MQTPKTSEGFPAKLKSQLHQLELFDQIPSHVLEQIESLNLKLDELGENKKISELLHNTTLWGGKRFRPLLSFLFGDFLGIELKKINPLARAIEMVHAASLSHDDVIDQATLRRGRQSINVASSNKRAILAGDYLLASVIVELTELGHLKLVKEMARVIKDLAEGEWYQMDGAQQENISWEFVELVALKKTASVMSWCTKAPAMLLELNLKSLKRDQLEEVIDLSEKFGINLGLAFQFIDDTLDFKNSSETGKDSGIDEKNVVMNGVHFHLHQMNLNKNLLRAQEKVIAEAQEKLDLARQQLYQIQKILPTTNFEAFNSLIFILDYLPQRKK